jgi:hypothetical protein
MSVEHCIWSVCFTPLLSTEKLFGFSEFLTGLALMVLAWTIADVRYRFRVNTAPIPLLGITFSVITLIGILTLLTDLWRAEKWLVPQGSLLTPGSWQAILAGLFLLTFVVWTWFAFIKPATYGKHNAKRYAQTLYRFILKGSPSELAVIADELAFSADGLVKHATNKPSMKDRANLQIKTNVEIYANELLLLIADKRLCRAIVESSPGTALAIFRAVGNMKKYGIQINTFAKNIVNEALFNKDSFLYHESEGYESGLIGYQKPLSHAMFSNYQMVEKIGTLLDADIYRKSEWDADNWKAYCRVVLITFGNYVQEGYGEHSFTLYRARGYIENAVSDLYKLNGLSNTWDTDPCRRLDVVVNFIVDSIEVLDKKTVPNHTRFRIRKQHGQFKDIYSDMAKMILEVIFHASAVISPRWECWSIQHNSLWSELFNFDSLDGPAGKVVKFKLRRLLYDEVTGIKNYQNHKGAKILGFCLNVMGFAVNDNIPNKDSLPLQKAILSWTRKNFVWLHNSNPHIAEACLVDGITYDAENFRLVRTYPIIGLKHELTYVYLDLDPLTDSESNEF